MTNANNATTNSIAQTRLENLKQEAHTVLAKAYGKEEADEYIREKGVRLDNDIFPLLFPDPFTEVPDVDLLTTIGKPNLFELRRLQRKQVEILNKRIRRLQSALANVPQKHNGIPLDNRYCNYSATKPGYMQEACEKCPICKKYGQYLVAKSLEKLLGALDAEKLSGSTPGKKPTDEVCTMFNSSAKQDIVSQRKQLIADANAQIESLRQTKKLRIRYIDNITRAIHDERTLPNLPLFVDLRKSDYFQDGEIVCFFLNAVEPKNTQQGTDTSGIESPAKTTLYLCKITGNAIAPGYGDDSAVYTTFSGEPLKSGEIYLNLSASIEDILNGKVVIDKTKELSTQRISPINPNTPHIMKVTELLELMRHPEYAKKWSYSNFHLWNAQPESIEPLLEVINDLADKANLNETAK